MLVVFGAINIDMVFPVPALPRAGETVRSAPGWNEPGGKGANQAMAAARDGAAVELVGAVGNDAVADTVTAGLRATGVRLRGLARHKANTGRSAICITPDGHTVVVADAGANRLARASQVADTLLGPRTTVLVQMDVDPAETAALIYRARHFGCRIVLNVSPARLMETEALRSVDLVIGASAELAWLGEHLGTGNNPASVRAALGVTTVRMMGVQGAEAAWERGYLHMPANPVQMRDSTVAGDCFIGVLAAALDRNSRLPQALRRAGVAAALSVQELGAGRTMPDTAAIDAALARAPEVTAEQPEISD